MWNLRLRPDRGCVKMGIAMYNILMVDDDLMILENNKTYFNAMG